MLGHRTLNFEDYMTILKRRWWILAIPAAILPIVAVGATFFIQPQYTSQSLLLIDPQKLPADFVKSTVTEDLNSRLATMKETILSRTTLQPIVEKYNLYASEHLDMDARLDKVRKGILTPPVESDMSRNGSPGFRVIFTADDPHTAQQVCSEISSLFTSADLRQREDITEGATNFLRTQLEQAKRTLDDLDQKLAQFQSLHAGSLPSDQSNNLSVMSGLNSQLEATTQHIQNLEQNQSMDEALLAQQSQAASSSTAGAGPGPLVEEKQLEDLQAEEAQLSAHYTDSYPDLRDVRRKIADLQKKMAKEAAAPAPAVTAPPVNKPDPVAVQQLRAQLRGIALAIQDQRKQQDVLQAQIRGYQGRIQSSPQVEEQEKELTRDYQTAQAFYDSLQAKINQSQMAVDMEHRQQGEGITVLDAANFPDSPTFPKQSVFAMGGLGGGLALGLLVVCLLEYRDTALRTERDVWAFTQLPTLAVIAWSGEMLEEGRGGSGGLKRLFRRKSPKLLSDSAG